MTAREVSSAHEAVGAYALGVLDVVEAAAFEQHMAGCDACAEQLEEFMRLEPLLGMMVEAAPASDWESSRLYAQPDARVLDRLVDVVVTERRTKRRRGLYLVAAAAALIVGGPLAATAITSEDAGSSVALPHAHSTSPAEDAFFNHMDRKTAATDPVSKAVATVGTETKSWGTHAVLELKNVKGPLKCSLIAVSKTGSEEVVTSWSVPKWGYGLPASTDERGKNPLYVHGGTGMAPNDIDHFEVRTSDGKQLVRVDA
ncbi:zf-HC2 domain-containing protein (plasmid) [Streptomyces zhihengii]|uniref:Zf-HC2 domain-containing protein n=1 Tax=Streptomyces zhihengii TaxID=1818004 RepID=A0ABS2V4U2_9ACTN|nr:zf-HC2 domain-containing protein [Streptomyces zhihengii]MBM9624527.1 zf-HC2 domain-containing protein [Streptomyces zhihengii]